MCGSCAGGWIGGGVMGEFEKAERDDWDLDRAYDHMLRQDDWDELHGPLNDHPTLAEFLARQRFCPHHDEVLDQYGKCRECYFLDKAYREDGHG